MTAHPPSIANGIPAFDARALLSRRLEDETLMRFLCARNLNIGQARDMLVAHREYLSRTLPVDPDALRKGQAAEFVKIVRSSRTTGLCHMVVDGACLARLAVNGAYDTDAMMAACVHATQAVLPDGEFGRFDLILLLGKGSLFSFNMVRTFTVTMQVRTRRPRVLHATREGIEPQHRSATALSL